MSGDPHQCRMHACSAACAAAHGAWRPDVRKVFTDMAATWTRLAAEISPIKNLRRCLKLNGASHVMLCPIALRLRRTECA
jgi:hypothetical protein